MHREGREGNPAVREQPQKEVGDREAVAHGLVLGAAPNGRSRATGAEAPGLKGVRLRADRSTPAQPSPQDLVTHSQGAPPGSPEAPAATRAAKRTCTTARRPK